MRPLFAIVEGVDVTTTPLGSAVSHGMLVMRDHDNADFIMGLKRVNRTDIAADPPTEP